LIITEIVATQKHLAMHPLGLPKADD